MIRSFLAAASLLALFCPLQSVRAAGDATFMDYDKVAEAAFPPAVMKRSYSEPTARQERIMQSARKWVLGRIAEAAPVWVPAIGGSSDLDSAQYHMIMEAMKKAPLWICKDRCPCGAINQGCAKGKVHGNTATAVIFIDPCLFNRSGCKESGGNKLAPSSRGQLLLKAMRNALTEVAYFKLHGIAGVKDMRVTVDKASQALEQAFQRNQAIMKACPGPFSRSDLQFMEKEGHIRELGPFADTCALQMLKPFRTKAMPQACRTLVDPARFKIFFSKELLSQSVLGIRCDEFCELITCADPPDPVPRALNFGERLYLSLPEGACEGAEAISLHAFVEQAVRNIAKAEMLNLKAKTREAQVSLCVASLLPRGTLQAPPKTEENVDDELTVDLIEN